MSQQRVNVKQDMKQDLRQGLGRRPTEWEGIQAF